MLMSSQRLYTKEINKCHELHVFQNHVGGRYKLSVTDHTSDYQGLIHLLQTANLLEHFAKLLTTGFIAQ